MFQPDFAKFFGSDFAASLPSASQFPFDVKSLFETMRKNAQAVTEAQTRLFEGLQTIGQRQSEILSGLVESHSSLVKELTGEGSPQDKIAKQADLLKQNYETSLSQWKELSDLASKSSQEASDIVSRRVSASLTEIKSSLAKQPAAAEAAANQARKKAA